MRKLHPDQRVGEAGGDERIKEINEAYQVLKHSSTRMEYDLKMAYDQKKRGSYFQRLSVPVSILIVLFILGTVYHKKTQITIQPVSVTQGEINQIDQKNQINRRNQINKTDQINKKDQGNQINLSRLPRSESVRSEMQSVFHRDEKDQRNQTNQMNEKDQRNQMNQINPIASTAQRRFDAYTHPRIEPIDSTTQLTQGHNDPMDQNIQLMQRRDDPINANMQLTQQPNGLITAVNQTDQINERNQINLSRLPRSESVRGEMRSLFHWDQINQKYQIDKKDERDQTDKIAASTRQRIDASTPLIATEEEVRQFFANYTERYTQKDLDGFLSLFSPRAVQNHQDGLEGIRKIYGNFFEQSQEIEYYIDDIKIEIYQNAAEVKARYELVQLLKKSGEKKIWRGDIRWTLVKENGTLKILSLDYQPQKSY
jgi:curved DNA-binding protein CbpA